MTISSSSSQTYTLPSVQIDRSQIIPGTGKTAGKGCVGSLVSFVFMVGLVLIPFYLISKFVPHDPFSRMFDLVNPFSFATKEMSFGGEGIGPGYFQSAREVAIDNNGYIYVIDYGTGQVQVFDEQGEFVTFWTAEADKYITGLAADRNGTVYVLYVGRVYLYEGATGELLGELTYLDDWSFEGMWRLRRMGVWWRCGGRGIMI